MYALKRVKINKMSKKEIADALNEIRFLASIRHKNIVGFLEAFLENNETELCIVMEFCGCGDLAQKVERYKRRRQYIDEDVIWRYLIQCLKALSNLHEKNICHRDLKVANSFLAEDGSVKIGDMNVSKRLQRGQLKTQIGTPYYMSPEIWNNRSYDASSDLWSLGCMMYELCALKPPFAGNSFPELKRAVIAGRYAAIPRKYSDGLGRVIGQMLRVNARERPSANKLLASNELSSKLQLDEAPASQPSAREMHQALMATIKVPQNLRKLKQGGLLPKPCYPDARPDSPTAWTVAEQVHANKKKNQELKSNPPPLPLQGVMQRMCPLLLLRWLHNQLFPPRFTTFKMMTSRKRRNHLLPLWLITTSVSLWVPSKSLPLLLPPAAAPNARRGYADYRHIQSRYAQQAPARKAPQARADLEPINRPRVPYGQAAPNAPNPRVAGHPVRVQYQHRMW